MELTDYFKTVWKWLWLIVLSTGIAAFCSYLAVRNQPDTYQAKTTLIVGQTLNQAEPTSYDIYLAQNLAQTYTEIARRQNVQHKTMEALNRQWLPAYSVSLVEGTQLLEIRVTDSDPLQAAAVADELARQLIGLTPTKQTEQGQRSEFVQQQLDDLEADINTTKAEIIRLQSALGQMFSAREIADTQTQIAALQQKLSNMQANYGQLLGFTEKGAVNTLNIIEYAAVPIHPIGPNRLMTILTAAAIGFALALAAAFLLDYMDDTVKTPADVNRSMQLTTLAGISRISGTSPAERLVTVNYPKSPISEAYRVLRTNLQFSSLDRPLKTIVVTSPNPVEGKSTTVANLGVVMAQAGKRVIVVDADLRRPTMHRLFGLDNREGLTTALITDTPLLDGQLQPTAIDNLRVLSTGPLPPNPSELLGSRRMATLIDRLKEEADVVLFDSPPSLAVTDASVLATQADGVLIVADAGRTRRGSAEQAASRLRQVGANLLGVVLNRLRSGGAGSNYYYYYYYHGDDKRRRRSRGPRKWLDRLLGRSKK
jgi:tyrosine-protein kinase